MKKFAITALAILCLSIVFPFLVKIDANASHTEGDKIQTDIFLPTSYLQYYKLEDPSAICRYQNQNEEFVAISQKNSIVIYKNEKFSKIELVNVDDRPVTTLSRYENYLLYLYDSAVWALDITGFDTVGWIPPSAEQIANPNGTIPILTSASSFSVYGDNVVCTSTDYVYLYKIEKDGFGKLKVSEISKTAQNDVTKLLLSNEKVYFSKSSQDGIYLWDGNEITVFDSEARNVRMLTESNNGDTVYYSCASGIYAINTITKTKTTVKTVATDGNKDLGTIYNPQGICLIDDKLWVVDNEINAVQEIDLKGGNAFTEFAITTNSQAVNRLTSNAKDIVVDKDTIYALDEGRIVVIDDISKTDKSYSRINLTTSLIETFSVGNGYVCYTTGNVVNVCKIARIGDEGIEFEISETSSYTLSGEDKIVDVSFSEGIFYLAYNKTHEGENHPYVCKIDVRKDEFSVEKVVFEDTESGTAIQIVSDVFGTVYYCAENGNNYEFYSFDGNEVKFIATKNITSKILNLQTDFDGKLYALYENNAVDIIEDNKITSKTLETSSNLGTINPAKSMCLSCNSQKAYFIFEGLILSSAVATELNVSTPYSIDIPKDFNLSFNPAQSFAKVKEGAKLFKVDATKLDGEHFEFLGYLEAKSKDTEYAIIKLDEKFSLLIKENVVAVARNSDVLSPNFSATPTEKNLFAIVDFKIYTLPVLSSEFVIDSTFAYGEKVDIVGEITFNNENFYIVKKGEISGYIPKTFLVDSVYIDDGTTEICDVYVYKKGGVKVYDADGNVIGTLNKKTKVTVLKRGNTLTIIYKDGVGYVDSDCIVSSSSQDILKAVAVILASISALVTLLFFEFRYLFRKS